MKPTADQQGSQALGGDPLPAKSSTRQAFSGSVCASVLIGDQHSLKLGRVFSHTQIWDVGNRVFEHQRQWVQRSEGIGQPGARGVQSMTQLQCGQILICRNVALAQAGRKQLGMVVPLC